MAGVGRWLAGVAQDHKTYPDDARRNGEQSRVSIRFTIDQAMWLRPPLSARLVPLCRTRRRWPWWRGVNSSVSSVDASSADHDHHFGSKHVTMRSNPCIRRKLGFTRILADNGSWETSASGALARAAE
jgi:hypothetical protein